MKSLSPSSGRGEFLAIVLLAFLIGFCLGMIANRMLAGGPRIVHYVEKEIG